MLIFKLSALAAGPRDLGSPIWVKASNENEARTKANNAIPYFDEIGVEPKFWFDPGRVSCEIDGEVEIPDAYCLRKSDGTLVEA